MDKFKKMLDDVLVLASVLNADYEVPYNLWVEVQYLIGVIEDMQERVL